MYSTNSKTRFRRALTWRMLITMGFVLFVLREAGCDYNITTNPDKSLVVVSVSPQAVTLTPSGEITLTAAVTHFQHDSTLTWSLSDPNIGQLSSNGGTAVYKAPASVPGTAMSVSVLVQSVEDPTKTAQAVITIVNPDTSGTTGVKVLLSPLAITLSPGKSQQFHATVLGLTTTTVTWQLVSGFGTITADGTYSAPGSPASLPTFGIIRASSTADPTRYADATITIMNSADSLVCFERDILPVLTGSCGMSGCHTPGAGPGDLTSYDGILSRVVSGSARSSRLYLAITNFDIARRMPPPPRSILSPVQIIAIGRWIDQGALKTSCSAGSQCDTTSVHYSDFVRTTMATYCIGCHTGATAGGGIDLSSYGGLAKVTANGRLMGSITFSQGFSAMPKLGPRLDDCTIAKIQAWVNRGYPND